MKALLAVSFLTVAFFSLSCASSRTGSEKQQESARSLQSVAESLSGKKLSPEDLKRLNDQLKEDEQAQSAVRNISGSFTGEQNNKISYCPVDGQRYSSRVKVCPAHHVELKTLAE